MTIIMQNLSRKRGVLTAIAQDVRQLERAVYIKVTVKKSTTKVLIDEDRFEMYRLVLSLVTLIVQGNPNVHS